jgi:hypothetical protein
MAGAVLTSGPWIIYSIVHFGMVWISDNSGTAFLVTTAAPTRIVMPGDGTQTLFNAPREWMFALVTKTITVIKAMGMCSPMADICILICIIWIVSAIRQKRINRNVMMILITAIVFYIGKTAMFILVGYGDRRYHIETTIFMAFIFMMVVENLGIGIKAPKFIGTITLIELLLTVFSFRHAGYGIFSNGYSDVLSKIEEEPEWVTELNEELCEAIRDKSSGILSLGFDAYTFGGCTDWKVYVAPKTDQWDKIEYAIDYYMDTKYVVISKKYSNSEVVRQLSERYKKINLREYYLFDLEATR